MAELLDFEGPWDPGLIELMLPVAIGREIDRMEAGFQVARAAAGSLVSREAGEAFEASIRKARQGLRGRSGAPPGRFSPAKALEAFQSMGFRAGAGAPGKRSRRRA